MKWLIALLLLCGVAFAAPPKNITNTVGVCDPNFPTQCISVDSTGAQAVVIAPGTAATSAVAPVATAAAGNNLVLKASAGNLLSASAVNQTATAGFLVLLNATEAPADGAITPLACVPLPANSAGSISYSTPARFSTGIVAVITSATTCFTKTTGVITGFISGQAL